MNGRSLLVIEDKNEFTKLLIKRLMRNGIQCEFVSSDQEVVKKLRDSETGIRGVFIAASLHSDYLDLVGLDIVQRIKEQHASAKILLLTNQVNYSKSLTAIKGLSEIFVYDEGEIGTNPEQLKSLIGLIETW